MEFGLIKMTMGFGQAEAVLADVSSIASDKRTKFQARLKNFHRLGLLSDLPPSRGNVARYEAQHLLMLGLAVEFAQLGVGPEKSVKLLRANEEGIAKAVEDSLPASSSEMGADWAPILMFFDPAGLDSLMTHSVESDQRSSAGAIWFTNEDKFTTALASLLDKGAIRMSLIDVTGLIVKIADALDRVAELKELQPSRFFGMSLREWAAARIHHKKPIDRARGSLRPVPRQSRRWMDRPR